jgi:DNA replication protein DnaC
MNPTTRKIDELLDRLRLVGLKNALEEELQLAQTGCPLADSLYRLLAAEDAHRRQRSMLYRLAKAKIPFDWTLESFPFNSAPAVNKKQIMELARLDFVTNSQNLVFVGAPGTGKTGLAIALLQKALIEGYRGRFYNAQDLLDELYSSLADRSTKRLINTLCRYDLLVIDELGYLTLKSEQSNAFFKLMGERYGRKATIITTNLDYEKWYDLFANKALVDALLDRLKHRCVTIKIDGKSLRAPQPPQQP